MHIASRALRPAHFFRQSTPMCLTEPSWAARISSMTQLGYMDRHFMAPSSHYSSRSGVVARPQFCNLFPPRTGLNRSWEAVSPPLYCSRRCYSSDELTRAHALLDLPPSFSAKQLKQAYLRQCQRLHPDHSEFGKVAATELFIEMAAAFDMLKECIDKFDARSADAGTSDDAESSADENGVPEATFDGENGFVIYMTVAEEEAYRDACQQWVYLSAELVEELKADPGFREWLKGLTDAADHWRCFLLNHGGLLPRHLRGKPVLGAGNGKVRRKRK